MALPKPTLPATPVATQAKYSPTTAAKVQHSQYLLDALRQNQEAGQNIKGGWGELGARLLATAVLQHASGKADREAASALRSDQNARIAASLTGLGVDASAFQTPATPAPAPADEPSLVGSVWRKVFGGGKHASDASAPQPATPAIPQGPSGSVTPPAALDPTKSDGVQTASTSYGEAVSPVHLRRAGLDPSGQVAASANQPDPVATAPTQATVQPPAPVTQQPLPTQAASPYSPQDRDALAHMIAVEAGGEGPDGMAAAGHVALNRLKAGYGGAKTLRDVITAPHQFEGISSGRQVGPQEMAVAQQMADAVLSGQIPDPTGGAQAFLNPDLQVQLGRKIPSWAQGHGQRIGRHVFFGGQPQPTQMADAGATPPPPPPPDPNGPDVQQVAQPFQVASNGPVPFPQQERGEFSAAVKDGQAPSFPPRQITAQQKALLTQYLSSSDPTLQAQGLAYAQKLQQEVAEETKYEFTTKDGAPVWADPYHPGQVYVGQVPQQLRTQTLTADQAAQFNVPPGTVIQRSPDGKLTFEKPANGQMVASRPGEPYRESFIPGSQNDPYRTQAPAQNYRYVGPGRVEGIQGSPADPQNPANVIDGTKGIRSEIAPVISQALQLKRNVDSVRTGFQQSNGSGDVAMVNGLQRLIDEGVVREGDVALQLKAQGLQGSIGGLQAFLSSKGVFDPQTRAKVLQTANQLYGAVNGNYRNRVMGYRTITERAFGPGSFDSYVLPKETISGLGWDEGASAPPPPPNPMPSTFPPGSVDAAIAEAVKRGKPIPPELQPRARNLGLIR